MDEAAAVLDEALFGNIDNMNYDEDEWLITWSGENFVVANRETEELFHFRVAIEPHEWDSSKALEDQEWGEEW